MPLSINGSIGGLRSDDSSFLADCTACNCIAGSELPAFATNSSKLIFERCLSISSSSVWKNDIYMYNSYVSIYLH